MSDLEDLWRDLDPGEAPVHDVLRAGRAGAAPTRVRWRRPLRTALVLGAVATAFVAGTHLGSSPVGPSVPPAPGEVPSDDVSPVAFGTGLTPAADCDDLLADYIDRGLALVTAWGWNEPWRWGGPWFDTFRVPLAAAPQNGRVVAYAKVQRVTASQTGTNVQEQGVDEPDTVKTDGRLLVRWSGDVLHVHDVSGDRAEEVGDLPLRGLGDAELLLAGDTVLVLGADERSARGVDGARRGTRVVTVSIADPTAPVVVDDVAYRGTVDAARLVGDQVRLVLSAGLPDLDFVEPGRGVTRHRAEQRNRRAVRHSTLADWLPTYDAGSGRRDLLACADVAVPDATLGLGTTAVVTFEATDATAPLAFGLAGEVSLSYDSGDLLYLASSPGAPGPWGPLPALPRRTGQVPGEQDDGTSYLFEFDVSGDRAVHVASGEVEGTIRDRWSMDAADGRLRLVLGPSSATENRNALVTLRRVGDRLEETGRLDGIGRRGDEVRSVRWQDDLAIVVTFRRVDPVHVIDLTGPRPRQVSELEVPGYSGYLHPLGPQRLVGVGYGPGPGGRWSGQLGIFAVRQLDDLRRIHLERFPPGSEVLAETDPRAFTWLPEQRTVLTVVRRGRTGLLSILRLHDGDVSSRLVPVEHGEDISQVRTLGLPDGTVVLVTGDGVRFLRL